MCTHTLSTLSIYTYIHVKKILSALGTPYLQLFHMAHYERSHRRDEFGVTQRRQERMVLHFTGPEKDPGSKL